VREIDQKALPACHLGRVTEWSGSRDLEVGAERIWHNASPIGKQWRMALSPKSTSGTPAAQLQDVSIHLHVAVRSLRT
jgi:hypothetical protein